MKNRYVVRRCIMRDPPYSDGWFVLDTQQAELKPPEFRTRSAARIYARNINNPPNFEDSKRPE